MIESMNSVFKFASKLCADNTVDDKRKKIKDVFLFSCFARNLNLVLPTKNIAVILKNKRRYPAYVINYSLTVPICKLLEREECRTLKEELLSSKGQIIDFRTLLIDKKLLTDKAVA